MKSQCSWLPPRLRSSAPGNLPRRGFPRSCRRFEPSPGWIYQQAGINRFLIAVRGFNNAFQSNTYTLVDHREAFNPALAIVDYGGSLPIDALDIERIEVVRGPGSALYGLGAEQGVIHFLTKDPFAHPGTSLAVGFGTQDMRQGAFRHAGVFKGKLGYKITGSYMQAEDWKMDPNDPHDKVILDKIVPELTDLEGEVVRVIDGRDYENYAWKINGQLEYRFNDDTRLTGYASYAQSKQIINASLGEIQIDGPGGVKAQLRFESGPFRAQAYGVQEFVDGDNWFYPSGKLMYGRSSEINLQAQYRLTPWENQEPIIVGADYKLTTPRTYGTISGRFEDEDRFSTVGIYVHSVVRMAEKFHLTASGRIDNISATGNTVFSPRVGLVYESAPEHTYRLTYNRAYSRLAATDYFGDIQVGGGPPDPFLIRYMGSANGFNFPDPPQTSSFVGPGRDTGIGLATARFYGALAPNVAEILQPVDPDPLTNFLWSKTPGIASRLCGIEEPNKASINCSEPVIESTIS